MPFTSIESELKSHLTDLVENGDINEDNFEDAHHLAFNEDHYIIGYHKAEKWLESHSVSAFKAIAACVEYERDNFGKVSKDYDNAETVVNMLAYVLGNDVVPYAATWEDFKEALS